MATLAGLGPGLMGTRMATRLLETGHRTGRRLQLASASEAWLEWAARDGAGDLDYSAVVETIVDDRGSGTT
jgi:hypothetical protein